MKNTDLRFICCVYDSAMRAEAAIEDLILSGFETHLISALLFCEHEAREKNTIRQLLYLRHLQVPSMGPLIIAGPLASSLANWAVAGFTIPLTEYFIELGISEFDSTKYFSQIQGGASFVYMKVNSQFLRDKAADILRVNGGLDIASSNAEAFENNSQHKSLGDEQNSKNGSREVLT